jgi:hypothetical protein
MLSEASTPENREVIRSNVLVRAPAGQSLRSLPGVLRICMDRSDGGHPRCCCCVLYAAVDVSALLTHIGGLCHREDRCDCSQGIVGICATVVTLRAAEGEFGWV